MLDLIHRRITGAEKLRRWAVPAVAATALVFAGSTGAYAATGPGTPATTAAASSSSWGPNDYGMTRGGHAGHQGSFAYYHGYYCDHHISADSTTGCEVGAAAQVAPAKDVDPLYITVPLGFTAMAMDCPDGLTCVDHPMSLDMTRLATALAPIYKTTPAKLTPALKNFTTPGHDHFITTTNKGKSEWWDVRVVGVTNAATYRKIHDHQSWAYLSSLIKAKNKYVVGPIPTNLYLFFAAH